jgi:3-dehydroquinate synthase
MNSPSVDSATRIVITGPTGAGKSTVGAALARLLGWRFADLDTAITRSEGFSAVEIFADLGEEAWRQRETEALRHTLLDSQTVIAAGAGIVERAENRELIAAARAWTFSLHVTPEIALERIQTQAAATGLTAGESRPMLRGGDPLAQLRTLNERRAPFYTLADDSVDASGPIERSAARALAGYMLSGRATPVDTKTHVTRVTAGVGYDAVTGWGALSALPERLETLGLPPRLSLVTDSVVGAIYAEPLARLLRSAGFDPDILSVPAGEMSKSRAALSEIHDWLAERRMERGEAVLALGGGVIGDLAGFAAATWMRGTPLVQLPTSLLAQVDASIGGKVAIDHPRGKNLIGAFYQPRLVVADTSTLLTLPERQRVEGWAEVIKHGVALDASYFAAVERDADKLLAVEPAVTTAIIARSVALKGAITSEDEREREGGRRALLNFGHTLGHAIEAVTGYGAWLHGEAVSAGMVFAARLGARLGVTPHDVVLRLEALLTRFSLPVRLDGLDGASLLEAALWDKKARGGQVRWVIVTGLGSSILSGPAQESALRETLAELGAG